jgi:hypothetical protein
MIFATPLQWNSNPRHKHACPLIIAVRLKDWNVKLFIPVIFDYLLLQWGQCTWAQVRQFWLCLLRIINNQVADMGRSITQNHRWSRDLLVLLTPMSFIYRAWPISLAEKEDGSLVYCVDSSNIVK